MKRSGSKFVLFKKDRHRKEAKTARGQLDTCVEPAIELDHMEDRQHSSMVPGHKPVVGYDDYGRRVSRKHTHEPAMSTIDEEKSFSVSRRSLLRRPPDHDRAVSRELQGFSQSPVDCQTNGAFQSSSSASRPVYSTGLRGASSREVVAVDRGNGGFQSSSSTSASRGNGGFHSSSSGANTTDHHTIQHPLTSTYPTARSLSNPKRDFGGDEGRYFEEDLRIPKMWMNSNENLAVRIPINPPPPEIPALYSRERRRAVQDECTRAWSAPVRNPYEFESDVENEDDFPATYEGGAESCDRPEMPGYDLPRHLRVVDEEDDDEWEDVKRWSLEDEFMGTNNHYCSGSLADVSDDSNTPSLNTSPNASCEDMLQRCNLVPIFRPYGKHFPSGEWYRRQQQEPGSSRNRQGRNPFTSIPPNLLKTSSSNVPEHRLSDQSRETSRHSYAHLDTGFSGGSQRDRYSNQAARKLRRSQLRSGLHPQMNPSSETPTPRTSRRLNNAGRSSPPGRSSTQRTPKTPGSKTSRRTTPGTKASAKSRSRIPKHVLPRPRRAKLVRQAPTMTNLLSPCPRMVGGDDYTVSIVSPPSAVPENEEFSIMYSPDEQAKQQKISQRQYKFKERSFSPHLNVPPAAEERLMAFKMVRCNKILFICAFTFVLLPVLGAGGMDRCLSWYTDGRFTRFENETLRKAWWIFAIELAVIVILILVIVAAVAARDT